MKRLLLLLSVCAIAAGWAGSSADAQDGDASATVVAVQTTLSELSATVAALQTTVAVLRPVASPTTDADGAGAGGRCVAVPPDAQDFITTQMSRETPQGWQMVQSADPDGLWFVAAYLDDIAPTGKSAIALWAMDRPEDIDTAVVYSVNSIARTFSAWGYRPDDEGRLSLANDGAKEAVACVAVALGF